MLRKVSALAIGVLVLWPLGAQTKFEFWPGAAYDPRIPTFKQVLGYEPGERISSHAQLVKYLEALASASPRLKVFEYGQSWEGRKLVYAAIGSEANMKRLAEIRTGMQALADPRKTQEAQARKLIAGLPAVIWLAYGVHGNEISSPDAALLTAYHLLAARNDDMVTGILNNVLVLIAPLQNPDGRDRFVHNFEQSYGIEPDPSPAAAEHNEPWPGGRGNHYLFDMNRDWFAITQPEIRSQVKVLQEWFPLVFADLHEMGSDSTYYFAPGADPYNPHLTATQKEELGWFGRNNAKWFDKFGFDYFTRDVFDAFYPGYGDSWPAYYGAVGMTYEQASARGLTMRRSDGTEMPFRDTIRRHFTASISTAEAASRDREKLIENFYRYRKTAVEEGSTGNLREYVLVRKGDTSAVDKLAALLSEQGVEVRRARAGFRVAGREIPAGSYAVSLAQPSKRLIRNLLDPNVPLETEFLKEQDRLRRKRLPDGIYDVTSWSLPLAFNVEALASPEAVQGDFEAARPERVPPGKIAAAVKNPVAYLVPWGTQAAGRFLAAALRENLHVLSSDKAFQQNGTKYPAGTLIFTVHGNPADLAAKLARLAKSTGANVEATESSWVDDGPNFGSRYVVELPKPAVALAWDRPTSSQSAGWTRFVLERQFEYPVTAVRAQSLGSADLDKFQVLILPEAMGESYAQAFGPGGIARLKQWVSAGGTVIALGSSTSFLADPNVGLLAVSQENAAKPAEAAKPEAAKPQPEAGRSQASSSRIPGKLLASEKDYLKAIEPDSEPPERVLGAMLRARLDPDHWMTAGLGETVNALVSSRAVFTPVKLDKGANAAVFAGPDQLLAAGQMWEESRKQFAYKPLVIVARQGRGQAIAFTADPNFRAYIDGMNLLFVNAVLRGPGHTRGSARD